MPWWERGTARGLGEGVEFKQIEKLMDLGCRMVMHIISYIDSRLTVGLDSRVRLSPW